MSSDPEVRFVNLFDLGGKPASRRYMAATPKERTSYTRRLGEVAFAWNTAHAKLFQLFGIIACDFNWPLAEALWHSSQSDAGQRAMLEASLGNTRLPVTLSHENAIKWAMMNLGHLAQHRNAIVHSDALLFPDGAEPGPGVRPSHARVMAELPLDKNWRVLCGDLHGLANYLEGVHLGIMFGKPRPLWQRPPLRYSRSKTASSQTRRRRAKKAARERQRQSSLE